MTFNKLKKEEEEEENDRSHKLNCLRLRMVNFISVTTQKYTDAIV
jgi:hypothetical protein